MGWVLLGPPPAFRAAGAACTAAGDGPAATNAFDLAARTRKAASNPSQDLAGWFCSYLVSWLKSSFEPLRSPRQKKEEEPLAFVQLVSMRVFQLVGPAYQQVLEGTCWDKLYLPPKPGNGSYVLTSCSSGMCCGRFRGGQGSRSKELRRKQSKQTNINQTTTKQIDNKLKTNKQAKQTKPNQTRNETACVAQPQNIEQNPQSCKFKLQRKPGTARSHIKSRLVYRQSDLPEMFEVQVRNQGSDWPLP